MHSQIGMNTESNKQKLKYFIGGLVIIALTINCFFIRAGYSEPQRVNQSAPQIQYQPKIANPTPAQTILVPQSQEKQTDRASEIAKEDARLAKLREEAAKHARFLARYLNTGFNRMPSTKSMAIVVVSEDGKLNQAISTALSQHLKTNSVELFSSFFKPEFVSDKLFATVFGGSTDVLNELEVTNSLDALILSRQTVQYSTTPSLMNLVTANMQLEVQVLPIARSVQGGTWAFTANGSGFKQVEARAMAEERLIKQISKDTKMSIQ
jgi:hypothetical protein